MHMPGMDSGDLGALVIGAVLLVVGAEALVRGAARLAALLGLSPLVIGLTVVAFGTSAPELSVSLSASLGGQTALAVGNVVGSNIMNVLLILGVSAVILPLLVSQQLIRLDVPIMISVSVLLFLLGADGTLSRPEGLGLVLAGVSYTVFVIVQSRRENSPVPAEDSTTFAFQPGSAAWQWGLNGSLIVGGLACLVFGSGLLVEGAMALARAFGVSELVIGLTVVAVGTSLPELATSVLASIRGERDLAIGNIVGSNIFNILVVLGLSSVVAPHGLPLSSAVLRLDLPIMLATAVACMPIFFTGHTIARWEGGVFLGYYLAYLAYLILDSTQHTALPLFSTVMLLFIVPLTVLTLGIVTVRTIRKM
jgi:cation:H+ antiporter